MAQNVLILEDTINGEFRIVECWLTKGIYKHSDRVVDEHFASRKSAELYCRELGYIDRTEDNMITELLALKL